VEDGKKQVNRRGAEDAEITQRSNYDTTARGIFSTFCAKPDQ